MAVLLAQTSAPWERQPNESAKAYAAFVVYRDLPLQERTLALAAEHLGKAPEGLARWSSKHKWKERVLAYDSYISGLTVLDRQKKMAETNARHVKEAQAFQAKAIQALKELDPKKLPPSEMIKWLQVAVDIERRALDAPTEIRHTEEVHRVEVHPNESPEEETNRIRAVIEELHKLGVLNPNGNLEKDFANAIDVTPVISEAAADPEVDEVHTSDPDGKTDGVPPA